MSESDHFSAAAAAERTKPIFSDIDSITQLDISKEMLDQRRIVGFESRDSRSRPYNLLRTQLVKQMKQNNWRMIGVTSATPAAGKTFTAVNLAAALAPTASAPIVLCDFDLRRGSIEKMFGYHSEHGLDTYLKGKTESPDQFAYRINDSQLVVYLTSATRLGSSELLATDKFGDFVARLRALPDDTIVICDLPPVFANDDAMMCMQHLDGYLLVVDHGKTTGRQIEESINLLSPSPCVGTVLNRYQGGFADPYGYGYGDAYGLKEYG